MQKIEETYCIEKNKNKIFLPILKDIDWDLMANSIDDDISGLHCFKTFNILITLVLKYKTIQDLVNECKHFINDEYFCKKLKLNEFDEKKKFVFLEEVRLCFFFFSF